MFQVSDWRRPRGSVGPGYTMCDVLRVEVTSKRNQLGERKIFTIFQGLPNGVVQHPGLLPISLPDDV